tara:strand:+ start:1974 stop:2270 length:297 start_codon:yes stop_codon:yes gene_type:complete
MPTAWSSHLKDYAEKNNMTYKQAMTDPKSKEAYSKLKSALPPAEKKEKKPRVKKVKEEVKVDSDEPVEPAPLKVVKRKPRKKKSVTLPVEEPEIFVSE